MRLLEIKADLILFAAALPPVTADIALLLTSNPFCTREPAAFSRTDAPDHLGGSEVGDRR